MKKSREVLSCPVVRKYAEVSHGEEPGAVIPHAGICEGAVRVTGRPTSTRASISYIRLVG